MGHSAFVRGVFTHLVLPHLQRVLYVDIGDVLVFGDVAELWGLFDRFDEHQLVGIADENGVGFLHGERYGSQKKRRGRARPNNTGILLLDLERQRQARFEEEAVRVSWSQENACHQADMSLLGWILIQLGEQTMQPQWRFELSSLWHYMPSTEWQTADFDSSYVNRSWPAELVRFRLFPGLRGPADVEHPCAQWYELAGDMLRGMMHAQITASPT
ncbi:unnamed protein product [Prorocentrum cordatum]|uniref:Uncharacterized protein n=1 Tax=Prorocentrum cordatum TaxID=2364126 RepID=A0ABN9UF13_9DINO|nr:unnamed protein product [Polarella glacialis]